MIQEQLLTKKYLGARFGYGERVPDGIYAVPCDSSRGNAFMKIVIFENEIDKTENNFSLYWDEQLTKTWYGKNKEEEEMQESNFSLKFRELMDVAEH